MHRQSHRCNLESYPTTLEQNDIEKKDTLISSGYKIHRI